MTWSGSEPNREPKRHRQAFDSATTGSRREAFREHAARAAEIFKEFGALQIMECWGDDVPEGEVTSFSIAVQRKEDETPVFSWIAWPSKEVRDAAWAKVMADPRMAAMSDMPFDGKRMFWGGFTPIVEA